MKVVPPGKSILSVLGKPHAQSPEPGRLHEIQSEVEDTIRRAFWDAVSGYVIHVATYSS